MANEKDYPSTHPLPGTPATDNGIDSPAEDPLVELARIVNRNRQPDQDAAAGRVGRTDYFAGLDDVALEEPAAPASSFSRVEPRFETQAPSVEPAFNQSSTTKSLEDELENALRLPEAGAPRQFDAYDDANSYRVAPAEDEPFAAEPAPEVEEDLGLDIPESRLDSGVALDLEANLTAELEDELQGVFRASFEPDRYRTTEATQVQPSVSDFDVHTRGGPASAIGNIFSSHSTAPQYQEDEFSEPDDGASHGHDGVAVAQTGFVHEDRRAPDVTDQAEPDQNDDDDLFASLTPQPQAEAPAPVAAQDDFDSLFAEVTPQRFSGELRGTATASAADDIDDMAWPAAAAAVPDVPDDETPPPPGGYDLEAVARAMQESDPTLAGSGVLPPHPREEAAAAPHSTGSRKGLYVAAAVLAVAIAGGGVFLFTDGNSISIPDGPPPLIAGLEGPLKVYPESSPEQPDQSSSKLIYDRVGNTSDTSRERLVLPERTAPAELPPAPEGATGTDPLVPGAPKKVRTLVVRPDGTIVPESDQPASSPAEPRQVTTRPVAPTNETAPAVTPQASSPTAPIALTPEPAAPAVAAPEVTPPADETPAVSEPVLQTPAIVAESETALPEQPANVPSVLPKKKPDGSVRTAAAPRAVTTGGPLDLSNPAPATQAAPVAAAPVAATPVAAAPVPSTSGTIPAGTYVVQVTSQRSADAARDAYSGLQRRFPQVLGGRDAVIVAAEIPDRGTFYRARIPMTSREDAISLCEGLQAAGGDCFVRRN
ncbi:SPOR domain-containing protein [Roseibium sp.]|uniref:SPOR domain-containing protein n=1 Tax=Roseibium sp. TaxID=1936156 RepID=UPI003A97A348